MAKDWVINWVVMSEQGPQEDYDNEIWIAKESWDQPVLAFYWGDGMYWVPEWDGMINPLAGGGGLVTHWAPGVRPKMPMGAGGE